MTNVTAERNQQQSATEQVKERVQDVAEQAKGQTREQIRTQINQRSTQAGEQVSSTAAAMRKASEHLRVEGKDSVAKVCRRRGRAERKARQLSLSSQRRSDPSRRRGPRP